MLVSVRFVRRITVAVAAVAVASVGLSPAAHGDAPAPALRGLTRANADVPVTHIVYTPPVGQPGGGIGGGTGGGGTGFYVGEYVTVDAGTTMETVRISAIAGTTLTLDAAYSANPIFSFAHANGAPVRVSGGFASGVVPPATANGSTGTVLKLYGDINADADADTRSLEVVTGGVVWAGIRSCVFVCETACIRDSEFQCDVELDGECRFGGGGCEGR